MSYKYNGVPPPNFIGVPMPPLPPGTLPPQQFAAAFPSYGISPIPVVVPTAPPVAGPPDANNFVSPHGVQLTYNPMTGEYKAYTQKTFVRTPSSTEVPIGKHVGATSFVQFPGVDQPYAPIPQGIYQQLPPQQAPQLAQFQRQKFVPDDKSMKKPAPPNLYQQLPPQQPPIPPQQMPQQYNQPQQRHSYPPTQPSRPQQRNSSPPHVISTPAIPISAMVNSNTDNEKVITTPSPVENNKSSGNGSSNVSVSYPQRKPQISQEHSPVIQRVQKPEETKEQMEKRNRTRQKVLQELVSTEESYCDSLENLILIYKFPLERDSNIHLDQRTISTIFSNIEQILVVSKDLLLELKRRVALPANEQNIGQIYIQKAQEMKYYVTYINNFENSMFELQKVEDKYPGFFKEIQKNNKYSLDIQSLLIMPVQRIPRYELLLKNLVDKTNQDHFDYRNLVTALESIREINSFINNNKGLSENKDRVATIAETLKNCPRNLVQPSRRWIREGILDTTCSNKKYCGTFKVYLFNDLIILAKQSLFHARKKKYEYVLEINLEDSEFKPISNHDTAFRFISDPEGKQPLILTFDAGSSRAKQSWISDLDLLVEDRQLTHYI